MSYSSLYAQVSDINLMNRLTAAVQKEAYNNPTLSETPYGQAVRANTVAPMQQFGWPLAVATEAAYEYALTQGNPSPGSDPAVITDADILSSVQANWPEEWPPPTPAAADAPPVS